MTIHAQFRPARTQLCEHGQMCVTPGPGHALSRIQLSLASATPSQWQDAIVSEISADGRAVLTPVFGGESLPVWHHADLTDVLTIGDPVSVHGAYGVLAVGRARFNVLVA